MRHIKKYNQLFEDSQELTQEQKDWLDEGCKRGIGYWEINSETGLIDVKGNFRCDNRNLTDLKGVRFGHVTGYFNCAENQLGSLAGAPYYVGVSFFCNNNLLESLEGGPQHVGGGYYCSTNRLRSLVGAPRKINDDFNCFNNLLTSLKGAPEIIGDTFNFSNNNVTDLEGFPNRIKFRIISADNPISELAFDLIDDTIGGGKLSLEEAVSKDWESFPEEDKNYLYKYNNNLSQEEKNYYAALGRFKKRVI